MITKVVKLPTYVQVNDREEIFQIISCLQKVDYPMVYSYDIKSIIETEPTLRSYEGYLVIGQSPRKQTGNKDWVTIGGLYQPKETPMSSISYDDYDIILLNIEGGIFPLN